MDDVLNVGDTICCHDYADMMDVMNELMKQGYIATAQIGYVVRIESVPLLDLDVRDPERKLIKHVIIGKDYRLSSHQRDDERRGKLEYIEVDINKHGRVGRSGFSEMAYDIDWKAIPKMYLDMEVDMIHWIHDRYGVNTGMLLRASVIPIQMGII